MNWGDARLPEAFWNKCVPEPNSGCWLWFGAQGHGYGMIRIHGKTRPAHRFAKEAQLGGAYPEQDTDHLCRTQCCVNPSHLEPVSHAENMRRNTTGFQSSDTQRELALRSAKARTKDHCDCGRPWDRVYPNGKYVQKVCFVCRLQRQRDRIARRKAGAQFA